MTISASTSPFSRSILGSILLLSGLFLISACSTSEPVQKTEKSSTRTLRLTAYDSTSGEPLDSARAINRTFGDTLETDSAGTFVIQEEEPALHIFDVHGYGYHSQRHVSVLVEPDDTTRTAKVPLLRQSLQIDCSGSRPFNWNRLVSNYRKDSSRVRVKLIDVFAEDGTVSIQPVVVNNLPTATLFLPDNYQALGHYKVLLFDDNNNPVPYTYEDSPPDEGFRIYTKEDILPIVPQEAQRLSSSKINVEDSVAEGTTLWARLKYTFSTSDTLQATSATTFPDLGVDSLQVPIYDTLRTDARVRVADSLVLQRDTTQMRIVGADTTVTRSGYSLFSTLRDANAVSSPNAAKNLLYVPDSVKARTRQDSLRARVRADTTVPSVDTAAIEPPSTRLRVFNRTDSTRVGTFLTDPLLANSLSSGLPPLDADIDDLSSVSAQVRRSVYDTPSLDRDTVRRGFDLHPDSTFRDSVVLSAPRPDSLFQLFDPDTLAASDTIAAASDTASVTSDADSTVATSDTTGVRDQRNPYLTGAFDPLTTEMNSISIDDLGRTIPLSADSVATGSVITDYIQDPPAHSYWFAPDSLSIPNTRAMVVDSSFFTLRSRGRIDTSAAIDIAGQLPKRIGPRDQITTLSFPQQVIRSPTGTYRRTYLKIWKRLQANELQENYCQIFPFPLHSEWRSTTMR